MQLYKTMHFNILRMCLTGTHDEGEITILSRKDMYHLVPSGEWNTTLMRPNETEIAINYINW